MARIAVTGHVDLPDGVGPWVHQALAERVARATGPGVRFVTCLAHGADQIFAEIVLRLAGPLEVVLPAHDYGRRMAETGHAQPFQSLLDRASNIQILDYAESCRDAYLAASLAMLDDCDLLLAVWDGRPSVNVGDTADVVRRAREREVEVEVVWPTVDAAGDRSGLPAADGARAAFPSRIRLAAVPSRG